MKIIVASFQCESNSKAKLHPQKHDFEYFQGEDIFKKLVVKEVFEKNGFEVVPSIYAVALPSATVEKDVYDYYAEQILGTVRANPDADGVFIFFHGSMEVEEIGSGELYLLKQIRKIVSEKCLIALSLDAHANITDELCDYANIISGFKTVPHIDQAETQMRSANALVYCLQNNIKPHAQMVRVPFLLKNDTLQTAYEPLKSLIEETVALEQTEEIFTANLFLGHRLYLYLGGKKNSEISLRNFAPITAEEYYEINDPFSYMGSKGVQILGTRDAEGNTTTTMLTNIWDKDEGAFTTYLDKGAYHGNNDCIRFNVNNGENHLSAVYLMEKLSALQKAEGKAYIKFDVKVDETYVNSTASNGKAFYFWVRCSQTTLNSGIGPKADASNLKADTWTTLYVDAEKLLEYYNNEADYLMYFQFTMYGPAGGKVSFKNMQAATQAEYEAPSGNNEA